MDELIGRRFVHVFEEDGGRGAVYRPEEAADIPLSRRPRARLELLEGGRAVLVAPGPDDRMVEQTATWSQDGDSVLVRPDGSGREIRIIEWSADRLLVEPAVDR
jgi:hypothetical protein